MKRVFALFLSLALILSAFSVASAEEGKRVLNWFIAGEVTTLDTGKTYDTLSGAAVAYFADTLYRLDQNAEPIPNLAVDAPVISEDGLTVTVTIRDNAYYANGEKIVAGDIVYAVQRVFDPAVGSQNTSITGIKNRDAVRAGELPVDELGVKAPSDTVVEFTLDAPDPYITKKLADTAFAPVSRAFVEQWGDQYALSSEALLASGPFSIEGWTGTEISWKYVKNPYYWDQENIWFDEINIQIIKDANTAINLYEAGQLDGVSLTTDFVPLYAGTPDLVAVPSLRMTNLELGINSIEVNPDYSNNYLQNLNIRKALLYGLDRSELTDIVLNGAATPAVGVIPNGIASSPSGESVAESFGTLVYTDIPAAQEYFRQGLEELGVDGIKLRLVTSDTDESIKIGTYLQSAYQTNLPGLTIDLANVPSSVRFDEMMAYQFDLALGGWTGDYDPTSYPNQFETSYAHNHGQWKSEELTALINALNSEDGTDFELRWEHLRQANQYLIDNAVVVPLEQSVNNYLVNPNLKGYITLQLGSSAFDVTRAYFED
ncbi:MAG: peptide ABC transporter substrate-binding protein [Clostridia bacterium]|nr:peptide ABC transporter substrate-binding protein [Clostridia bacterium]